MKYLVNAIVVALIVLSVGILLNSISNRTQNKKISELESRIVILEKEENKIGKN